MIEHSESVSPKRNLLKNTALSALALAGVGLAKDVAPANASPNNQGIAVETYQDYWWNCQAVSNGIVWQGDCVPNWAFQQYIAIGVPVPQEVIIVPAGVPRNVYFADSYNRRHFWQNFRGDRDFDRHDGRRWHDWWNRHDNFVNRQTIQPPIPPQAPQPPRGNGQHWQHR